MGGSCRTDAVQITHFTQQYDNYLNLQLVQQSNKDGTSMGLISLVTLVFLPGTFAAVSFSSLGTAGKVEASSLTLD